MSNIDIVDRNKILGAESLDYGFDKVLRGYDVKQVNEYITNLINSNKNATEIFDRRYSDLSNENSMLSYELNQKKGEVQKLNALVEKLRNERDSMAPAKSPVDAAVDEAVIEEYKKKIDSLLAKNRLLAEENKKLEGQNRDLQRDVAHLTKKVDKNRTEIKSLKEELENGMDSDAERKHIEIEHIYEAAIDKAEDLIYRIQTELSLAHSKAEDITFDKQ